MKIYSMEDYNAQDKKIYSMDEYSELYPKKETVGVPKKNKAGVLKTTGKTILAGTNYLGQGVLKGIEGIGDTLLQVGSSKVNPYYWFNPDKLKEHQAITKDIIKEDATKNLVNTLSGDKNFNENVLDKDSLIKESNLGGAVAKSIGQMLPSIAIGSGMGAGTKLAENVGLGVMGVQSFGGGLEEAYNQGATRGQATSYALMDSAIETATEKMFAGIGGVLGKGALDDAIKTKLTKKMSNAVAKKLTEYGLDMVGEGVEELASDLLQPLAQKLTYANDKELKKLYQDQNYLEDFVAGALSAGVMQGVRLPSDIRTAVEENATKKATQEKVKLPGTRTEQSISNNIEELRQEQRETTDNKIKQELATKISGLEQELNQFKLPMASTEGMTLQESASKYNIKPETQNNVQQLMDNRNIESRWDATKFSDNSVNALWSKDANGNRQVIFNPNASLDTIIEEVAVHELTHDILSSENTTLNPTEILDYVSQLDGYNEARQSLIDTYKDMYDVNSAEFNSLIDEEVVADVLGRKLGNQEFIDNLVNSKPSIAKSIYNWVVNKLNSIVNKGKVRSEKLYWENIKNNFENAYRQEYKNNETATNEDIRFSLSDTGKTGTLMAIHNLSEDKLKGILELRGFPVPSIAITNPSKINHEGYGNISVLFDKNTIDPFNNKNEVYSRDVWSPRFPTINREILRDNVSKVAKNIGISDSSLEYLAEDYNNVEDLSYRISRDSDVVEKYLNDNNISYNNETNIRKLAEENGIIEYLNNQLKDIYGKKGIRNDKEIYTPSGSRRSFNQLHDEYNLENLVKTLTKKKTIGGEESFASGTGVGTIEAKLSKKLNSIEDIKKYESEIKDISYEEKQKFKDAVYDDMAELNEFRKYKSEYSFYDNSGYALNDFAEYKEQNLTNLKKALEKNEIDSTKVPESLLNKTIKDINALKNIPTDYFEAKPQRAVGLDEVEAIVIPNNVSEELRNAIRNAGLNFVEYDSSIKGDRQRVINTFDNLKFSKNSPEWNNFVNKHIPPEGTKTKLKDIKLSTKEVKLPGKTKKTLPMVKEQTNASEIANEINNITKSRGLVKTLTESDALKGKVLIEDLDPQKINYVVQTNKSSLDKANNTIDTLGYEKSLDRVKQLINDEKLPSASDVALMQRMIQEAAKRGDVETVQDLIMDTAIVGTDLGQATQALSIIQKLTPEGQLKMYTKLVQRAKVRGENSFKDVEITPKMAKNILDAYKSDGTYDQEDLNNRVEQFKQEIANQMKTTTGEKVNAWRYLSMLGNPKTHIRNIVSNVAMNGTIKVKNAMARTLESVLPIENRTKTWKKASTEIQNYANKTANEMKDIITGEAKYNEKTTLEAKKQIFKNKTLEKISDFNSKALEAEDWFFSKMAFKNTLQEYLTANGINTLEDIKNNPEVVEKAKIYAIEQAEIATFRQYSKLASAVNSLEKNNKAARLFIEATMPFKKTPINVAKAGVKYSPLGLIKAISYDIYQVKQGNMEASQFIDNLSQGLTGTSLAMLGYALAKAGILNGAGGDDKDNKYDSQLGDNQYSLKIGDKSYSISWLSPVAMPLLVGANAYEQLEGKEEWDMNVVSDTLAKTLDPLNEMSFMQGLTNALTSYGSGVDKIKGSLESVAQNYVGQFFPTLFSQFASTIDDKKRSTKASANSTYKFGEQTLRSVMYKLPGLRQQLEVATDIWGNEKEQADNIIQRAYESFIAPYSTTKNITSNLDKEIKKVYNKTGETGVIPSVPYSYIKYKDETYRMSANEYTKYKKTFGQNANKYLNNLISSNAYKNASNDDKAKMIKNTYDYAKAEANEQYFKGQKINYSSDTLKELNALKNIGINDKSLAEYISNKTLSSTISGDKKLTASEKHEQIANNLINSNLNDKQLAYLYSKYYSTDEKLNNLIELEVPIKEFIKLNSQDIESDYNSDTGKTISNSKKNKVINYINSLNLSVAQKAILIKSQYNSFNSYNNEIINYVNKLNKSINDKKVLLKSIGFDNYDRDVINYINSQNITKKEKETKLKSLGFTIRDGRVYSK